VIAVAVASVDLEAAAVVAVAPAAAGKKYKERGHPDWDGLALYYIHVD
jgi:hypothetical protein